MVKLIIKQFLKYKGITIKDLAKKLNVTPSAMPQSLSNNNISIQQLEKIANAIGCSISQLYIETIPINSRDKIILELQEKIKQTEKLWANVSDDYRCSYYNSVISSCEEYIVILEKNDDLIKSYIEIEQDENGKQFLEDCLTNDILTTKAILKASNDVKHETLNLILTNL